MVGANIICQVSTFTYQPQVNHSKRFVLPYKDEIDGKMVIHTNTIEGAWAAFKKTVRSGR